MLIVRTLLLLMIGGCSRCLYPVLLVPGDVSSQLTAVYTKTPPHLICGEKNKSFLLWLNIFYMIPCKKILDCLVQTMKLNYSVESRKTFSPDFCEVQVPGFGTVDTIDYLTRMKLPIFTYYADIIQELVDKFGYIANKNILGAPYDFRKGPNEMGAYLKSVIALIEKMYSDNGGHPVIIIAHSLGNLQMLRIFNEASQQWKNKFVKVFISVSAPYSGSMKALSSIFIGFANRINYVNPLALRPLLITWPSTYYLFPFPSVWSNETIVATKQGNFSAQNIKELLKISKVDNSVNHFEDVIGYMVKSRAPNVTTYCIISRNIPTVAKLDFTSGHFPSENPKLIHGDGDGSVNIESLKVCGAWKNSQRFPVEEHVLLNVSHFTILRNNENIAIINSIIAKTIRD